MIGQCFMIGFEGVVVPPEVVSLIRDHGIGGVLLFASNCPTVSRTRELIAELKSYAKEAPLCIAIDHEGGRVHRLPKPVTHFPPMRELGALMERLPSSTLALDVGRAMGEELKGLGIDWNFAPVVDVDTNPFNPVIGDRALGNNAEVVALAASQIIQGLQEKGVAACAKHFPGHGDTNEDSHEVLPRLPHNMKRLESLELIPFEAAIQQKVASIMPAHVVYEGVEKNGPATFSVKILRDLLRTELGFDGVIVSDSLDMGAVARLGSLEECCRQAFAAGCDWLIVGKEPQKIPPVLEAFEKKRTFHSAERVASSLERIQRFKARFCPPKGGEAGPNPKTIGSKEHQEILNKIKQLA